MDKLDKYISDLNAKHGPGFAKINTDEVDHIAVVIDGHDGIYDEELGNIEFTENVSPEELDEDLDGADDIIKRLTTHIDYLAKVKDFITKVKEDISYVEANFYWSEGDLNLTIYITIP